MATPTRSRGSRTLAAATLALATVLNYAVWLAWDQQKDFNPVTNRETGPYEAWQVIGAALVLAVLAFAAGWRRQPVLATIVIPVVFTTCWSVDAATQVTPDANLWPIGAVALAMGTLAGAALFALAGFAIPSWRDRARATTSHG